MKLESLFNHRLIFVTGKGGVGKSSVTAAIGKSLAEMGRKTLILETDTYSAMEDLFNVDSAELEEIAVGNNLWIANLRAEQCFIATVTRFLPSERLVRALLQNRVARAFFNAAPSVNEVTILDQVRIYLNDTNPDGTPRFDHIVIDLPASGHAVTFLHVPETIHAMMSVGPIGKMAGEMADIIRDATHTAIVAVCLPEEMPVNETLELADNLQAKLKRPLTLAIANMVHKQILNQSQREVFDAALTAYNAQDQSQPVARLLHGSSLALGWHDRDQKYLQLLHSKLRETVVEVPIFYEITGANIIERMAQFFLGKDISESNDTMAS